MAVLAEHPRQVRSLPGIRFVYHLAAAGALDVIEVILDVRSLRCFF
jgi:hypothetical protein